MKLRFLFLLLLLINCLQFSFSNDIDLDGVLDDLDLCPLLAGEARYSGCSYAYSKINCEGDLGTMEVDVINSRVICKKHFDMSIFFGSSLYDYASKLKNTGFLSYGTSIDLIGTGFYSCDNDKSLLLDFDNNPVSSCKVRYNVVSSCVNILTGLELFSGESIYMYKFENILPGEILGSDIKKEVSCNGGVFSELDFSIYSFSNPTFLPEDYDDVDRDIGDKNYISKKDDDKYGKVHCNREDKKCKIKTKKSESEKLNDGENINLDIAENSEIDLSLLDNKINKIKIYKNSVLVREDVIDPVLIAVNTHKLKRYDDAVIAQNFIEDSFALMNKVDIVKDLTYIDGKTIVKIKISNISLTEQRNLVIYQSIPKSVATNLDELNIIGSSGGEFFVFDIDPIIGWYFNDSGSDAEIEYETSGTTEGGTIIVAQDPNLYNNGELVVRYREVMCNEWEIGLFELDYLIDSNIYHYGAGKSFKVCLSNIDSNISLFRNLGNASSNLDVMSYQDSGNASLNLNMYDTILNLGTNTLDNYWSSSVSMKKPSGNYSCIGSFTYSQEGSTFGSCGDNPNLRLWIHLGKDYYAPISNLETDLLSHIVPANISVVDNLGGSGVKGFYYCEDLENKCDPISEGIFINSTGKLLVVTCPNNWGCLKYIRIQSIDNSGNIEKINSKVVKLVDVGNSCQSDCTVKPNPGRYLSECNNLNSCEYYKYDVMGLFDNGVYVSEQCDLAKEDSYVRYNSTHDILCPNGPFVISRYGTDLLDLSETECDNLYFEEIPVIVDNDFVLMKIYTCLD